VERLIYALQDPRIGHIRYIGLSSRGMRRPNTHLTAVPTRDRDHRANWLRGLKAAGYEPTIVVVEYCDSDAELSVAEQFWIEHFKLMGCPLTNLKDGGFNGKHTAESRAKMSEALRGRTLTADHRAKIGASQKGTPRSATQRAKISAALSGRTLSAEQKQRQSDRMRGVRHPMFGRHVSEITKQRISAAQKARFAAGAVHPRAGAEVTETTRQKIRDAHRRRRESK